MIDKCCICGRKTKQKCEVFYGEFIRIQGYERQVISICPNCGYIYVANPCSLEMTNAYYSATSHNFNPDQTAYLKRSKRQMQFIFDNIAPIQTVLEIGATTGSNLSLYKEQGLSVCGTDLSMPNIEFAKAEYNIDLFHMDFDHFYAINKEKFDLVILSNVLEHIINPYEVMRKIASINSKYVFIEVPSFDYKYADRPYGMFIPTHQSYFTLESLKNLMKQAGYRILDSNLMLAGGTRPTTYNTPLMSTVWEKQQLNGTEWDSTALMSTITSEQHLNLYLESSKTLLKGLAAKVDCIPDKLRLAVWCLSQNTAILFHHTNLGQKNIIKFYDSNKVFYERKILGRDIGPFNKADAEANKIEAILISSYEHQTTIFNQILASGVNCDIIKLYH